jgi:hypothetical protein
MTDEEVLQTLEHATLYIINERFPNVPEEACRILEDYNHPLQQAVVILHRAKIEVDHPRLLKKAAMLIEQHRCAEETV